MDTLDLRVRYFQDSPPPGRPYREEHFVRREIAMSLPRDQTALVLVDLWDTHFIESFVERAGEVTRDAVVPVLETARAAGLTVIHAPSPRVTPSFPEHMARNRPVEQESEPDWPPPAFRNRQGEYEAFRGPRQQPPGVPDVTIGMSPLVDVADGDYMVETGQQLHELCRDRGLLHLLYAGYATNWCVHHRNYGLRSMSLRGYNTILLRDATTGIEYPDTVDTLTATEMSVREAEQQLGFSAANRDFFAACERLKGEDR